MKSTTTPSNVAACFEECTFVRLDERSGVLAPLMRFGVFDEIRCLGTVDEIRCFGTVDKRSGVSVPLIRDLVS